MATRREFLAGASLPLMGFRGAGRLRMFRGAGGPTGPETATPTLARLRAVSFRQVRLADSFWAPRQRVNREATVPHLFKELVRAGHVGNFDLAAMGATQGYRGPVYMDSDLFKSLEAAADVLAQGPDSAIASRVDELVAKVRAAQRPDGYVNTFYQVNRRPRFSNLRDDHELYCAGHLIEAGLALQEATGQRALLEAATRYADLLVATFGEGAGRRSGYCGHPEIELALVKLSRATGERRYFDLARFFLEHRGEKLFAAEHNQPATEYDGTYFLDQVRIREHEAIVGHAVRAAYLFAAVADVAGETGDAGMLAMLDRVFRSATQRRMFVTGGIGTSEHNEGFTTDYDLPGQSAYQETCAGIALALWSHRMGLLYGDSRYADVVERALYNAIAAGVSLEGTRFFYVNPLASNGTHHREPWYNTACCPPNVARTVATLGGYAYAVSDQDLYVNLYLQGTAQAEIAGGRVGLEVRTEYPWEGRIAIVLGAPTPTPFALRLRVPAWCRGPVGLRVNGVAERAGARERGYLVLRRSWREGDRVELDLPMPVRRLEANPLIEDAAGRVALARGPLVYCIEQCDQDVPLATLTLPAAAEIRSERAELLGGTTVLKAEAASVVPPADSAEPYREALSSRAAKGARLTAIPYCAWDNRAAGPMKVWILRS